MINQLRSASFQSLYFLDSFLLERRKLKTICLHMQCLPANSMPSRRSHQARPSALPAVTPPCLSASLNVPQNKGQESLPQIQVYVHLWLGSGLNSRLTVQHSQLLTLYDRSHTVLCPQSNSSVVHLSGRSLQRGALPPWILYKTNSVNTSDVYSPPHIFPPEFFLLCCPTNRPHMFPWCHSSDFIGICLLAPPEVFKLCSVVVRLHVPKTFLVAQYGYEEYSRYK